MEASRIGQAYVAGQVTWPERAVYLYTADGHVLTIFLRSPNRRKLDAIRTGRSQFALVPGPGIFFIMYRFGKAISWSAASDWTRIVPIEKRAIPPEGSLQRGVVLHVILVDAGTGLVRATRAVTLPPGFTCELHNTVRMYARLTTLTKAGYDAALADTRKICPTNRRILQRAVAWTGPAPPEKLAYRVWLHEYQLSELLDLLRWFVNHSYDDCATLRADAMIGELDAFLDRQRFIRGSGADLFKSVSKESKRVQPLQFHPQGVERQN